MRRTSIFCNIFDFNFLKIPNFYFQFLKKIKLDSIELIILLTYQVKFLFKNNRECLSPGSWKGKWIVNRKSRKQMVREGNGPRLYITEIE